MSSILFIPLFIFSTCSFLYFDKDYKQRIKNPLTWIAICIFVFIIGFRANYGTDHQAYLDFYVGKGIITDPLYKYFNDLFFDNKIPYQYFFSFVALVQILCIFFFIHKTKLNICYSYFIFFICYFYQYVNILRQALALSVFLLFVHYLLEKKYIKSLCFAIIAFFFHKSALFGIMGVMVLLLFKNRKINKYFVYMILFLFLLFWKQLYNSFFNLLLVILAKLSLSELSVAALTVWQIKIGSGIGVYLNIISYILMMPVLLDQRKSNIENFYFNLFFIGLVGELMFSMNMNVARLFLYFSIFQIYTIPQAITSLRIKKNKGGDYKSVFFIFGILLMVLLFIYDTSKGVNNTLYYSFDLDTSLKNHFN